MNYLEFLTVDPIHSGKHTRVTKVTPKKYGFRVRMFNSYVTIYYLKIEINADKSAKISWKVDKNYQPINRYTTYHGANGEEISRKEYYNQKKQIL